MATVQLNIVEFVEEIKIVTYEGRVKKLPAEVMGMT